MESLALFFSAFGRIARKPFAIGVVLVYVLIILSQMLLSPAVTARGGVAPFAVVQAGLTWSWYALHAKRLRDADRNVGSALGIAILYGLSVVLFLLLVEMVLGLSTGGSANGQTGDVATVIVILFLFALFTGEPSTGLFFYLALGILILILTPLVIALGFSIWAGTRRQAPASTPP